MSVNVTISETESAVVERPKIVSSLEFVGASCVLLTTVSFAVVLPILEIVVASTRGDCKNRVPISLYTYLLTSGIVEFILLFFSVPVVWSENKPLQSVLLQVNTIFRIIWGILGCVSLSIGASIDSECGDSLVFNMSLASVIIQSLFIGLPSKSRKNEC
jgi:hypothetical protein